MAALQEYRNFIAVVEKNNLTLAAESMHRSTSAVSRLLAKLEGRLGVRLIDRTTQSLTITPIGEQFYHRCKEIVQSLDEAEGMLKGNLGSPAGTLTISMPEVLLRTPLMSYLSEFIAKFHNLRLNFLISNKNLDLLENRCDFAFRIGGITNNRLCSLPLARGRLILVVSPAFIKQQGQPRSISTLFNSQRIILPSYINVGDAYRRYRRDKAEFDLDKLELDNFHRADNEHTVLAMAAEGMGAAFVLDISVRDKLADGSLIQLFPSTRFKSQQISLVHRQQTYMPRKILVFKDFIKGKYTDRG